jgi:Holliday junction resolvase
MRHNPRKDRNHNEIKEFFELQGCTVWDAAGGHGGIPDLIIGFGNVTILVEVKDGKKPPSERKLTGAQLEFFNRMQGANFVCYDIKQAEEIMSSLQSASYKLHDRFFEWPCLQGLDFLLNSE